MNCDVPEKEKPEGREATVYIVDDDPGALAAMGRLLEDAGLRTRCYSGAQTFLAEFQPGGPDCLLLDLRMPEVNGLAVVEELAGRGVCLPTIIVTGAADVRSCAQAFKLGVMDFLEKPVDEEELIDCVRKAMVRAVQSRRRLHAQEYAETLTKLTPREREVFELVVTGMPLKQIAARYKVTVQAVWKHQRRVLEKFGVQNAVELVQLVAIARAGATDNSR